MKIQEDRRGLRTGIFNGIIRRTKVSCTFEDNINWEIPKPQRDYYLCRDCECSISEMCEDKWESYNNDRLEYLVLKFKDTYKNGN